MKDRLRIRNLAGYGHPGYTEGVEGESVSGVSTGR